MKPLILAAVILAFAGGAEAGRPAAGALEAGQPWSRPAIAGGTAVGYMTLSNHGKAADVLVAVESPLARRVEVHLSMDTGGMASMQPVARLALPAAGSVTFSPGGYHLMFVGLTRALNPGDVLPATLSFASGAHLKVVFRVGTGATPAAAPSHDMSNM